MKGKGEETELTKESFSLCCRAGGEGGNLSQLNKKLKSKNFSLEEMARF